MRFSQMRHGTPRSPAALPWGVGRGGLACEKKK
jgi:hypothetical protein